MRMGLLSHFIVIFLGYSCVFEEEKMKSKFFIVLALILSHLMCIVVAYSYSSQVWGIKYAGYSAPPSVAFISGIPFAIGILACLFLAFVNRKKK